MGWKTDSSALGFRLPPRWMLPALFTASFIPGVASSAEQNVSRCVDASRADALVTLAGKLTLQSFAGPPNYESIAQGDAEEQALILELPRRICLDDGEFADGSERFDRVHIHAMEPDLLRTLRQSIGQEVTVAGRAMGAHTAHHRAPLVLFAGAVEVREKRGGKPE